MSLSVHKADGSAGKTINLPEKIFGVEPREAVMHSAVISQLKNQRQGNAATLTRMYVSGGGIKPWRQKGTGRARAGSIRSPLWPGGGTVFGPHPKEYRSRLPKKQKRLALLSAFSSMARDNKIKLVESLDLPDHKTKNMAALLGKLELTGKKVLILDEGQTNKPYLAGRNIPGVQVMRARLANAAAMLNADVLLITLPGLKDIEEVFG